MDTILQALLSWQFLLFCLALSAVTFVIRKISEFVLDKPKFPLSKTGKFWKDLVLPTLPVFIGAISAFLATNYPFPTGLEQHSGRIVFGLVAGLFSGLVYRVLNSFLASKIAILTKSTTALESDTNMDDLASKIKK